MLQLVFSHLEFHDLLICRLVCKLWNTETSFCLQTKTTVQFKSTTHIASFNQLFKTSFDLELSNYDTFAHTDVALNFQKPVTDPNCSSISEFFTTFKWCIHHVTLTIQGEVDLMIFQTLSNLPQLSSLALNIIHIPIDISDFYIANSVFVSLTKLSIEVSSMSLTEQRAFDFLRQLLSSSPYLQLLTNAHKKHRITSFMKEFLQSLLLSCESNCLVNLCRPEFPFKADFNVLKCMASKPWTCSLVYLHLEFWSKSMENENHLQLVGLLNQLLCKFSATLNFLRIEFPAERRLAVTFTFPCPMVSLKSLVLVEFEGSVCQIISPYFTPVLERLEVSQMDLELFFPKNVEIPFQLCSVTSLTLDFCLHQSPRVIRVFGNMCPVIRKLRATHVTDGVVRAIFKSFGHVQSLVLHGDEITDSGICGLTIDDINVDEMAEKWEKVQSLRKYAYIGDLKSNFSILVLSRRHCLVKNVLWFC